MATGDASRATSKEKHADESASAKRATSIVIEEGVVVNASGHRDQLRRQYGTLEICALAINIDNAWIAFAGSLSVAVLNGGPPGILYEFITACVYYSILGASIAELASSIPSSGGVYHWASVTAGPQYGRALGFFAGSLNFFGWIFDLASIVYIPAHVLVQMYAVYHPEFEIQAWHTYVAYCAVLWASTAFVIFCNRLIPKMQHVGLFLILAGLLVTVVVVTVMPSEYASNSFVWSDFQNFTGWSGGIAFLAGVLNGSFVVGTPAGIAHMAEELPNPTVDLPKAVFAQVGLGFVVAFVYGVAVMYGINDLEAVINAGGSFPIAEVYSQATGSANATFGLLLIMLLSILICAASTVLMVGRLWWSLARDNATPFPKTFSRVNERLSCPIQATILCSVLTTGFGAIALGSTTAFNDLVGSFIILTTSSYFLAFLPNLLTRRRYMPRGWFRLGRAGFAINGLSCVLIVFFNVCFCFPYSYPVAELSGMNWNSVILVGVIVVTAAWWYIHAARNYPGPKLASIYARDAKANEN